MPSPGASTTAVPVGESTLDSIWIGVAAVGGGAYKTRETGLRRKEQNLPPSRAIKTHHLGMCDFLRVPFPRAARITPLDRVWMDLFESLNLINQAWL